MLAPPPQGTFDVEGGHVPIKSQQHNGSATPEQVPLLSQEPGIVVSNVSNKGKARVILLLL